MTEQRRYRVLFTGSRRMKDPAPLLDAFWQWRAGFDLLDGPSLAHITVVHGAGPGDSETGAPGCDALVDEVFRKELPEITIEPHPPLEAKFGRWPAAGPRRNEHMVELGADVCLAFPCRRSKGTVDCMQKAWKAGIPTRVVLVRP